MLHILILSLHPAQLLLQVLHLLLDLYVGWLHVRGLLQSSDQQITLVTHKRADSLSSHVNINMLTVGQGFGSSSQTCSTSISRAGVYRLQTASQANVGSESWVPTPAATVEGSHLGRLSGGQLSFYCSPGSFCCSLVSLCCCPCPPVTAIMEPSLSDKNYLKHPVLVMQYQHKAVNLIVLR